MQWMKRFVALVALCSSLSWSLQAQALEEVVTKDMMTAVAVSADGADIDVTNYSSLALTVTMTGTATLTFKVSEDGTTFVNRVCVSTANTSGTLTATAAASAVYQCNVAGLKKFRVSADITTGTVTVHARASTASLGGGGGGSGGGGGGEVTNAGVFAVQVSSALPAGTNAIGKLAANSGVDIGDVDVTSVPVDPFGANADAASATGSISAKLRFMASTGIPITGTVTVGSHAVTNAGTFVVQENGAALTALQLMDDVVHTSDAAINKAALIGCQFDNTSPGTTTENSVRAVRCSTLRELYGIIRDAAGNERGANVNASNELLTNANTELPAAVQSTTTGQTAPTAPFVNAFIHCQDASATTVSPCVASDNTAHDAADAGNPLKIGAKAIATLSTATLVAAADRTNLYADLDGVLLTRSHAALGDRIYATPVSITDGSSTSVVAAQGAGIRFCATTIVVANTSATGASVDIRDGTAGAVKLTVPAAANFGGGVISLPVPICTTANTIMAADPSAAVTSIVVSIVGFNTKL